MYSQFHPYLWEQKLIFYITTPIDLIAAPIYMVLAVVYSLLAILVLPLMILILAMTVIWLPMFLMILLCGKLSRSIPILRPLSFIIALPFLIVGRFWVALEPLPSPADQEAKALKLRMIDTFPILDA